MKTVDAKITIDVWSDFVCPWCWIAKKRFEKALDKFEHSGSVVVNHYSYRIGRSMRPLPFPEALIQKLGSSANADMMMKQVSNAGLSEGLVYNFESMLFGDTSKAHALTIAAREMGLGEEMAERLFFASTTEGRSIFDKEELVQLAKEVGVNEQKARSILDDDSKRDIVDREESKAHSIGVRGVPFFLINKKFAISGAQPTEQFLNTLNRSWKENQITETTNSEQICDESGCKI